MSLCRVFSCFVWKLCLLWVACYLDKFLLNLLCFILLSKAKLACYSGYLLTSYLWIPISYDEKDICFGGSSKNCCRSSCNWSTSTFLASVVRVKSWITVILNGLPWKVTEIILPFLRLYPSTAFCTFLLTVRAVHFLWKILYHSSGHNGHLNYICPFLSILVHWFLRCWYSVLPSSAWPCLIYLDSCT